MPTTKPAASHRTPLLRRGSDACKLQQLMRDGCTAAEAAKRVLEAKPAGERYLSAGPIALRELGETYVAEANAKARTAKKKRTARAHAKGICPECGQAITKSEH